MPNAGSTGGSVGLPGIGSSMGGEPSGASGTGSPGEPPPPAGGADFSAMPPLGRGSVTPPDAVSTSARSPEISSSVAYPPGSSRFAICLCPATSTTRNLPSTMETTRRPSVFTMSGSSTSDS